MTTSLISPRLTRGALVSVDPVTGQRTVIAFQYNPETLTRSLSPNAMGGEGGDKVEVYRLKGPPAETITLNIEIDATDKLEEADSDTVEVGIYPILSALELLVYPKLDTIRENARRAQQGEIEIIPPEAPTLYFVWGSAIHRVLPVRITSFSITEEAHDLALNPTRARVDLSLQVLSTLDFRQDQRGYQVFDQHHQDKQSLAGRYHAPPGTASASGL
jgi:hypothetical protein